MKNCSSQGEYLHCLDRVEAREIKIWALGKVKVVGQNETSKEIKVWKYLNKVL